MNMENRKILTNQLKWSFNMNPAIRFGVLIFSGAAIAGILLLGFFLSGGGAVIHGPSILPQTSITG